MLRNWAKSKSNKLAQIRGGLAEKPGWLQVIRLRKGVVCEL